MPHTDDAGHAADLPTLTVRQVREALVSASTPAPALAAERPAASNLEMGTLFHEALRAAIQPRALRALASSGPGAAARQRHLLTYLYHHVLGPRLSRDQARFQAQSGFVLTLWSAFEELAGWIGGWGPLAELAVIDAEPRCERVLHAAGWRRPVRLVGRPDAVIRPPGGTRWCLIELKLGGNHPEADLSQAVLYQELLRDDPAGPLTDLVLVRFEPGRREIFLSAEQLSEARSRLFDLIGRLANVAHAPQRAVATAQRPILGARPAAPRQADAPSHPDVAGRLIEVLAEFGVAARQAGPVVEGPTFLRVPVEPGRGVRVQSIEQRDKELQIRLGLERPPWISTQGTRIMIDLQRLDRQIVRLSEFVPRLPQPDPIGGSSCLPVGVDLDGRLQCADLARPEHTHLLVAGTVGCGKSSWLTSALAGLMHANRVETLRLLLIDPKRVTFQSLQHSPYLLEPLIHGEDDTATAGLGRLIRLMDERYSELEAAGVHDWGEYVQRLGKPSPRIVCVCDEYADLISGKRARRQAIEQCVTRLGSKARAAGIHLIMATQQPSREVIKGALDAVIPARVGLRTNSPIESRMLLGQAGAERLLGQGDLLFKDLSEPVRLQGLWCDLALTASAQGRAKVAPTVA